MDSQDQSSNSRKPAPNNNGGARAAIPVVEITAPGGPGGENPLSAGATLSIGPSGAAITTSKPRMHPGALLGRAGGPLAARRGLGGVGAVGAAEASPGASQAATSALQAIPFGNLIGGPLKAAIEAQALAAQSTAEFITRVGIDQNTGVVRTVTFIYMAGGQETHLTVPLLTIMPIPYIRIDDMTIGFKADISAQASAAESSQQNTDLSVSGGASWSGWGASVNFNASYSDKKDSRSSSESKYAVQYTMDVNVRAVQDDMPAGLQQILNALTNSISHTSPATLTASAEPNFITVGQTSNFTVKVVDANGSPLQGGTVQFVADPNLEIVGTPPNMLGADGSATVQVKGISLNSGIVQGTVTHQGLTYQGSAVVTVRELILDITPDPLIVATGEQSEPVTITATLPDSSPIAGVSIKLTSNQFDDPSGYMEITNVEGDASIAVAVKPGIDTGNYTITITATPPFPQGEATIKEMVMVVTPPERPVQDNFTLTSSPDHFLFNADTSTAKSQLTASMTPPPADGETVTVTFAVDAPLASSFTLTPSSRPIKADGTTDEVELKNTTASNDPKVVVTATFVDANNTKLGTSQVEIRNVAASPAALRAKLAPSEDEEPGQGGAATRRLR
jgi:hypothetical protein